MKCNGSLKYEFQTESNISKKRKFDFSSEIIELINQFEYISNELSYLYSHQLEKKIFNIIKLKYQHNSKIKVSCLFNELIITVDYIDYKFEMLHTENRINLKLDTYNLDKHEIKIGLEIKQYLTQNINKYNHKLQN